MYKHKKNNQITEYCNKKDDLVWILSEKKRLKKLGIETQIKENTKGEICLLYSKKEDYPKLITDKKKDTLRPVLDDTITYENNYLYRLLVDNYYDDKDIVNDERINLD